MDDTALRDRYLKDIETLPAKKQLSAICCWPKRRWAGAIIRLPKTTSMPPPNQPAACPLVRRQLRYAFDHGNALEALTNRQAAKSRCHQ